jgi:hypothetical protein
MSLDDIPPLNSADLEVLLDSAPLDDGLLPLELLDPHPAPWLEPISAGKLRWGLGLRSPAGVGPRLHRAHSLSAPCICLQVATSLCPGHL